MSNEEMDRAIAGYLGADCMTGSRFATWPVQAGEMLRKITVHVAQSDERDGRLFAQIPHFSTDLNAIHEAEKLLTDHWDGFHFRNHLCNNIHATARQRAEAFLKTIGKWRDE